MSDDVESRLQILEHNLESLMLQVSRIEKALDDLALWADKTGSAYGGQMADTIRSALNHLRP